MLQNGMQRNDAHLAFEEPLRRAPPKIPNYQIIIAIADESNALAFAATTLLAIPRHSYESRLA